MNKRLVAALLLALALGFGPMLTPFGVARAQIGIFGSYYENVARAAKAGDANEVRNLLASGHSANDIDDDRRTGLIYCAMNGNTTIAALLVKAGAKLDYKDPLGQTALYWATERNQPAMVSLLLEAGATVDAEDRHGTTPLMIAAKAGNLDIVQLLLAKGANPRRTDFTGRDAASWAAESRRPGAAQTITRALAARH